MTTILQDFRHALRLLAGHRGFAAAALLTIALGVGGTSAVFSMVDGVLLRPLPYAEPERLVRMWEVHPGGVAPISGQRISGPAYRAWAKSSRSFETIGAFGSRDYNVRVKADGAGGDGVSGDAAGGVQRLGATRVTPSVFRLLRVSPAAGRFFTDADAEQGAPPVVVISHRFWRTHFAADREGGTSQAIGGTLMVDDVAHRIVGVTPPGFAFPTQAIGMRDDRFEVMLYVPLAVRPWSPTAKVIDFTEAIARLAPAVTAAQAEAEGTAVARAADRPLAELVFGKGRPVEMRVRPVVDQMTMRVRPALMVLAAGVTLVLLIACANLANLFLSRGSARSRELAVRAALGASRRRVMRQLLTESLVIALLGGALGVIIGIALTAAVPLLAPADFPRLDQVRVDVRFLIVAVLAAVFAGVVSGAAPAFRGSRIDLVAAMQTGGGARGVVGSSGVRMRRLLLSIEAALAVVLLIGAALLARSFAALVTVDAGYDADRVLTATVQLPRDPADQKNARTSQRAVALVERVRAIPGVRAAGAGDMAPFGSYLSSFGYTLPGMTGADGKPLMANGLRAIVTTGYAEALGMRLKEGRWFRDEDMTSAIRPILVNEAFAKTYLHDGRPIVGRTFPGMFADWLGPQTVVTIVGVVRDMLPADLDARAQSQIFVAQGAGVNIGHITLVMSTDGDPAAMMPLVKSVIQQMEPTATIERMSPLASKVSASFDEPRFATLVLVAFASLALMLAATGLYGVLSFNIAQRRRELAVRVALGATRTDVVSMVMREGMTMTLLGLIAGIALAAALTRTMASTLFGVTPLDAVSFSIAPLLLAAIACIACLLPARRALAIDPGEALKAE